MLFPCILLSLAETDPSQCALGNVAVGETHLDGLVTVMDLHCPMNYDVDAQLGLNDELVNRYLIL